MEYIRFRTPGLPLIITKRILDIRKLNIHYLLEFLSGDRDAKQEEIPYEEEPEVYHSDAMTTL